MPKNILAIILLYFFLLVQPLFAQSIENLIKEFLEKNNAIAAKNLDYRAKLKLKDSASAFSPPVFGAEYMNMPLQSPYPGKHPMSSIGLSLSQKFDFIGTSSARRAVKKGEAKYSKELVAAQTNDEVAALLFELAEMSFLEEKSKLTESHIKNLNQMNSVVNAKYRVNRSRQFDLLRLKVLIKSLEEELLTEKEKAQARKARINKLLYRDDERSNLPNGIELSENFLVKITNENLEKILIKKAPALQVLKEKSGVFNKKASLEGKLAWPKVSLSVNYKFRSQIPGKDEGSDFIGGSIKVPLTFIGLGSRSYAKRDANKLKEEALLKLVTHATTELSAKAKEEQAVFQRLKNSLESYEKEIVPHAIQAVSSVKRSYEVNETNFSSLFETQKEAINIQTKYLKTKLNARLSQIKLKQTLGLFAHHGGDREPK